MVANIEIQACRKGFVVGFEDKKLKVCYHTVKGWAGRERLFTFWGIKFLD